jgi:hypothetical protein
MAKIGYIKGQGIYFRTEINTIPKKGDSPLQPIFEAFTNSWESIRTYQSRYQTINKGYIFIDFIFKKNLISEVNNDFDLEKIAITDSGIGFDDCEFERFINLRDNRKNYSNKGTGRVQFLHSFHKTHYESIYKDINSTTGYKKRQITLSKIEAFLAQNAIARLDEEIEIEANESITILTFEALINPKDSKFFNYITAAEIKKELIRHYLAGFCENRSNLPSIKIRKIVEGEVIENLELTNEDIPIPEKNEPIEIRYSKLANSQIVKTENKETFNLKAFLLPTNEIEKNELKLISKGEIAKDIRLENLLPTDSINNQRYLFLLSGTYIDDRDNDVRGEINIHRRKDFKKLNKDSLFSEEQILLEDIEEDTNEKILSIFDEIKIKTVERTKTIEELQKMFLLNSETLNTLQNKIHIGDSDDIILKKVYEADARIVAEKDAEIKQKITNLESLDTSKDDYQEKLKTQVEEFVKIIPLQNRTALTQYVARRKMVLELFRKILDKEITKLKNGGRIDESLMHNLIFQQSSSNPEDSDLWLVNEEFIYFKGTSEGHLGNIKLDNITILKDELTAEEEEYRLKQQGDANQRRTDILLFPKEGKCIIIELKAPDINVTDHLNQINRYASLINNLSREEFNFNTYYGYLIGENIDVDDIEDNDSDFKSAHGLNYIFRPYKRIAGKFGKSDGALYTEIIKYSTLLERANLRNEIFIKKLEGRK